MNEAIELNGLSEENFSSSDSPFHSYNQNFKSMLEAKPTAFSGLTYRSNLPNQAKNF
jgi:hypothetical protein